MRVGYPELIAVGSLDDHQTLAPPAVLERGSLQLEIGTQFVILGCAEGEIDHSLADSVWVLRMEQEAALVAAYAGRPASRTKKMVLLAHRSDMAGSYRGQKNIWHRVDFAVCSFDASVEPGIEGPDKVREEVRKDTNDAILMHIQTG